MKTLFIAAAMLAVLSGCGIAAKVEARSGMQQSLAAYKACLAQNPQNVQACEGAKLAYDADMKAYRATSSGIQRGYSSTVIVEKE